MLIALFQERCHVECYIKIPLPEEFFQCNSKLFVMLPIISALSLCKANTDNADETLKNVCIYKYGP